jgi:hypothetical protein
VALFALLLGGCQTGRGTNTLVTSSAGLGTPGAQYQAALAGETLPVGRVVGKVGRFNAENFVPAGEVTVQLDDAGLTTTTDEAGCYAFDRVTPGVHRVSVSQAGYHPMQTTFRVGKLTGLGRVNVAQIPVDLAPGAPQDVVYVAGLATDPRGVSLPRATVRVVDSLSEVGNWAAEANDDGFWWLALRGVNRETPVNGTANLSVYGRTPGGVPVEATSLQTFSVGREPTVVRVAGTTAFGVPQELVWASTGSRRGELRGDSMPRRRDEVVLRFRKGDAVTEILPSEVTPEALTVMWPRAFEAPGTLELLPLGLVPPQGSPPSVALP